MRRGLAFSLGATVLASIAALWGSEVPNVVSAIEPRLREAADPASALRADHVLTKASPPTPLPAELPRLALEEAKRDVFLPYAPPPPPAAPAPVAVIAAPPPPPPPPAPQAPMLSLRFLGSMVTPAGQRLVYLARGDTALPIKLGDRLDEGYVVTALTADAVTLTYPSLDAKVVVPIPTRSETP